MSSSQSCSSSQTLPPRATADAKSAMKSAGRAQRRPATPRFARRSRPSIAAIVPPVSVPPRRHPRVRAGSGSWPKVNNGPPVVTGSWSDLVGSKIGSGSKIGMPLWTTQRPARARPGGGVGWRVQPVRAPRKDRHRSRPRSRPNPAIEGLGEGRRRSTRMTLPRKTRR